MGPQRQRESNEDAAQRQIAQSNSTLNQFLGGSRRPSWLTGGIGAANPTQGSTQSASTIQRTPPRRKDTGAQRSVDLKDVSSTSASPHLPNNVPVIPPETTSSSISPPQTPHVTTTASPTIHYTSRPEADICNSTATSPDVTRKRKEMDENQPAAIPKGVQVSDPVESPTNLYSPNHGVVPGAVGVSNVRNRQASAGQPMTPHTRHLWQSGRHVSSPMLPQYTRQQAHGAPSPVQTGYGIPPHPYGQSLLQSNLPPQCGPYPPTYSPYVTSMQQKPSSTDPTACSPTIPSPVQQFSNPVSQNGPKFSSPRTHQAAHPPPVRQPIQQEVFKLPVIEPYSRRNIEQNMEDYLQHRVNMNFPPLHGVEISRFKLVKQAAQESDSLFLFLHQVVSQSVLNLGLIPSLIRDVPQFQKTSTLLNTILAGAFVKDIDLLAFFGQLPCVLHQFAAGRPDNYQDLQKYIKALSSILPQGWEDLKKACERRGYPPVATEFWQLNVYSPTLMDTFFKAALRQVWPPTATDYIHGCHEDAEQIFKENKQALHSARTGFRIPQDALQDLAAEFQRRFAVLARKIQQEKLRRAQAAMVPLVSPPIAAIPANQSNGHVLNGQVRQSRHQSVQGAQLNRARQRAYAITGPMQPISPPVPIQQQNGLLVSPAGAPRPDQPATSTWQLSAVHQAHLREPRFTDMARTSEAALLYQYVYTFLTGPKRLILGELYQAHVFTVPDQHRIAQTIDSGDGQRKLRHLEEGIQQYRLRMVKAGALIDGGLEDPSQWILKATSWPPNFYYQLNEHMLEPRKKQHHTKDLPIDITEHVRHGRGDNKLEIFINSSLDDPAITEHAFVVEIVSAKSHETIMKECESRTISSEASLKAIMDSLNRGAFTDGDDDDIIIDNAKMNIMIYDPIGQGQVCELPARGKDCKHRECFDLVTFLRTRPREKPHWPSDPDAWKCPICLGDVRPHRIIIDGFLKEVRDKLVSEGKEKVRTIIVDSDGTWTAKIEEGISSERSTPEATGLAPPVVPFKINGVVTAPFVAGSLMGNAELAARLTAAIGGISTATSEQAPFTGSTSAPARKRPTIIDLSEED
jgi:hypothetical protein